MSRSLPERRLAGAVLFITVAACGVAEDPESTPVGSSQPSALLELACSEEVCAKLAGPCQLGSCDAQSGICRIEPVREGEPCLEGNACGAAQCRSGACVPLAPPACTELDDGCHRGVCRIEQGGCVAERRDIDGARCQAPIAIASAGFGRASAPANCAAHSPTIVGCTPPAGGPSTHFELDLRAAPGTSQVLLVIDAGFPFEAALTRGSCEDPALVACAEPFYADEASRRIDLALEPGLYRLIVTAAAVEAFGAVHVASAIEISDCEEAPPNDECQDAVPLDASLVHQSVIATFACADRGGTSRCQREPERDVFYRLDLTDRPSTLLDVHTQDGVNATLFSLSEQGCGDVINCGERFTMPLPAGEYALSISQSNLTFSPSDLFLARVGLDSIDCSTALNDRIETAIELDPALDRQHISGNTACGLDDLSSTCDPTQSAPDLFYRLDLRERSGPVRVNVEGPSANGLISYVLTSTGGTGPLAVAGCAGDGSTTDFGDIYWLAPRLYFLVLDGRGQTGGGFDFEVTIEPEDDPWPAACLYGSLSFCPVDSEPACRVSEVHPDCLAVAVECGLLPDTYAEFCSAAAGCCDGSGDEVECMASWRLVLACYE